LFASSVMEKYVFKQCSIKRSNYQLRESQMSGIEVLLIGDKVTHLQNCLAQQRSLFRSSAVQSDTAVCVLFTWFLKL
jgi:hypothetical protein